jgi:hypothetical protein
MQHHAHLALGQAHHLRGPGVADLVHHLDLQEVVPGAQGAELGHAAFDGPLADVPGPGVGQDPAVLAVLRVGLGPDPLAERVPHAFGQQLPYLFPPKLHAALCPHPSRDTRAQRVDQLFDDRLRVAFPLQVGADQPDAAGDVEPHAAG